jgi:hypothetical protein
MPGIKRIQEIATPLKNMLRLTKEYEKYMNRVWNVDENIELLTRVYVRAEMRSIFSGVLCEDTVEELSDVCLTLYIPHMPNVQRNSLYKKAKCLDIRVGVQKRSVAHSGPTIF